MTEVVAAGRLSRRRPFVPSRRSDRAAIERALEAVDLADHARIPVSTLSGGQQQRVLIARTLAGEPELMVLDEPNAGVDLASQQAIAGTLASMAELGATIVVVLHELGQLADVIQRSVVLARGQGGVRRTAAGLPRPSTTTTTTTQQPPRGAAASRQGAAGPGARDGPVPRAVHAAGAARGCRDRAGRTCGRHLPRAAPALAHGRRHRARLRHRGRPRPADRYLADPHRRGGRDPGRAPDRADPLVGTRQPATSRWRCCSTAASPVACCWSRSAATGSSRCSSTSSGRSPRSRCRPSWSASCWRPSYSCSRSRCCRSCSRWPTTRTSRARRGCRCASTTC